MSDTMQSLDQLSQLRPATPEAPKYVKKVDKHGRAYATGKRKDAVARVWIKPGAGKIVVNTREVEVYFARPVLRMMINQPLVATNRLSQFAHRPRCGKSAESSSAQIPFRLKPIQVSPIPLERPGPTRARVESVACRTRSE